MRTTKPYYQLDWSEEFRNELIKNNVPYRERSEILRSAKADLAANGIDFKKTARERHMLEPLLAEVEKIHPGKFTIQEFFSFIF